MTRYQNPRSLISGVTFGDWQWDFEINEIFCENLEILKFNVPIIENKVKILIFYVFEKLFGANFRK